MSDRLNDIQAAIDNFHMDEARQLIREEMQQNPTAELYYLASQAAINHGQRIEFLEKAVELDPSHQTAHDELASIVRPTFDSQTDDTSKPAENAPVEDELPSMETASPATEQPAPQQFRRYLLAPVGKRAIALMIDTVIVGFVGTILGSLTGLVVLSESVSVNDPVFQDSLDYFRIFVILLGAVYYIYFMVTTNGQTIGKQMLKIRVIKKDGKPLTAFDVILRNVIGYMLNWTFIFGFVWAFFDRERQGWHDKLARTIVVDDTTPSTLV